MSKNTLPFAYIDGSVSIWNNLYYIGFAYVESRNNSKFEFITVPVDQLSRREAVFKAEMLALELAVKNGYVNLYTDNCDISYYALNKRPEVSVQLINGKRNKAHSMSRWYLKVLPEEMVSKSGVPESDDTARTENAPLD